MAKHRERPSKSSVDRLVREMYGSLSEETRFEQTLHRLGSAFRSTMTGLHSEDFGVQRRRLTLVGDVSADDYVSLTEAYGSRWSGQNLWMERSLAGFQQQGWQQGDAVVSKRELEESPYYRHFLKPLDVRYGLGIQIWSDDKLNMAVASFHRGHRETGFDADDIRLIETLRPHMINAYAIYRRVARIENELVSLRASFEHAPLGMIVLDRAGHVLQINVRAEECVLASSLAACGPNNRLRFAHPVTQGEFETALHRLEATDAAPISLALRSRTGCHANVALHLCRVEQGALSGFDGRAGMLAFVAELGSKQRMHSSESTLQSVLGLSRAEARVALALLQHGDPGLAAAAVGVSLATVRTHVKNLHALLDVRRTSDLLLMLDRLLAAVP
jgi:DNA-binding CsgD family transcriptional regulator/PAS domain-containing protein